MENNIEIKNLTKSYDHFKLDNINLNVPKGTIVGLVGENGAGKTTLIKCILNLVKMDAGSINVFNQDHITKEKEIKEDLGVVLDNGFFYEGLTPLQISNSMKHFYKRWDKKVFNDYLTKFELNPKQPAKELSKGMKMKLQIAIALSHHPKILILDEPTSGLDPVARNEILDIFMELIQDEEKSILFSTHITSDLERIADYITFVNEGKIVLSKTRDELLEEYGIVKCDEKSFQQISSEDKIRYRKNRYDYEVLIENKKSFKKKYPELIVDNTTIEDIMILYIKGVK